MSMIRYVPGKIVSVGDSEENMTVCDKCGKKYPKFWKKCPYCSREDKNEGVKSEKTQ